MRALVIVPYPVVSPAHGGAQNRTWHLVSGMEKAGIETEVWSVVPAGTDQAAAPSDRIPARQLRTRGRSSLAQKLGSLVSRLPTDVWQWSVGADVAADLRDFDAIVHMTPLPFDLARQASGMPQVLDLRDDRLSIEARLAAVARGTLFRVRARLDAWKWRRLERRLLRPFAAVTVVSEREAGLVRAVAPAAHVVVSPNGVDTTAFPFRDHTRPAASALLMNGHFATWPNLDGARWLTSEIFPALKRLRPDAGLSVVGINAPPGPFSPGIASYRNVPDMHPYLDHADVFIVPLRAGGGTRLKILEAFASGLPTVSTTIGCEGLPVANGVHLLVADTTAEIVAATLRLLDDTALRATLATNARRLVEDRFEWDEIAADFAALVTDVVTRGTPSEPRRW